MRRKTQNVQTESINDVIAITKFLISNKFTSVNFSLVTYYWRARLCIYLFRIARTEFRSRFISPILRRERTVSPRATKLNDRKNRAEGSVRSDPPSGKSRSAGIRNGRVAWVEEQGQPGQNRRGINFFFGNSFAPGCASMPRKWPATAGSGRHVVNQEPRRREVPRKNFTIKLTAEPRRANEKIEPQMSRCRCPVVCRSNFFCFVFNLSPKDRTEMAFGYFRHDIDHSTLSFGEIFRRLMLTPRCGSG